jgi:tight adherence protein C
MLLVLAFVCLAGALTLAGQALTSTGRDRSSAVRRARSWSGPPVSSLGDPLLERLSERYGPRLARVAVKLDPRASEERVGLKLVAAGMAKTFSPTEFLAAKVVLGAAGVALGGLLGVVTQGAAQALLLAVVLGIAGFVLLDLVASHRARERREQMRMDLPDVLDILAVSVEAGLSFDGALAKLSEHKQGPLVEQFQLVLSELAIGENRSYALRKMADRLDIPELTAVVTALIQSEQLGSPLGKMLRTQATEARQRRRVAAEERAMKAPVKMVLPIGLFIFPSVFIVIIAPALITIVDAF